MKWKLSTALKFLKTDWLWLENSYDAKKPLDATYFIPAHTKDLNWKRNKKLEGSLREKWNVKNTNNFHKFRRL